MEIFFGGIVLRPWLINDAAQLALIADNKKIADNLRDGFPFPYSLQVLEELLKKPGLLSKPFLKEMSSRTE